MINRDQTSIQSTLFFFIITYKCPFTNNTPKWIKVWIPKWRFVPTDIMPSVYKLKPFFNKHNRLKNSENSAWHPYDLSILLRYCWVCPELYYGKMDSSVRCQNLIIAKWASCIKTISNLGNSLGAPHCRDKLSFAGPSLLFLFAIIMKTQ